MWIISPYKRFCHHLGCAGVKIIVVGVVESVAEDYRIIQKSKGLHPVVISGDIIEIRPQKFIVLGLQVVSQIDIGEGGCSWSEGFHVGPVAVGIKIHAHVSHSIARCISSRDRILIRRGSVNLEIGMVVLIEVEVVVVIAEDVQRDVEGCRPWPFLIE